MLQQKPLPFSLCMDGERIIRTYECTQLRRWFLQPTIGYLTVTTQRIVFHSSGKSLTGRSLLISEMPIQDASGISVFEGTSVNWFRYILLSLVTLLVVVTLTTLLPPFFTSIRFAILLLLPHILLLLLMSRFVTDASREQVLSLFNKLFVGKLQMERDLNAYQAYTHIPFYVGLILLITRIVVDLLPFDATPLIQYGAPFLAYLVLYFWLFGRQGAFSITIGSKSKKDSGIYIPGDSFTALGGRDTTAFQALSASPAKDASQITRELGAMLMDISLLGEHGIEKWQADV